MVPPVNSATALKVAQIFTDKSNVITAYNMIRAVPNVRCSDNTLNTLLEVIVKLVFVLGFNTVCDDDKNFVRRVQQYLSTLVNMYIKNNSKIKELESTDISKINLNILKKSQQ
jgi:hypothetical protein